MVRSVPPQNRRLTQKMIAEHEAVVAGAEWRAITCTCTIKGDRVVLTHTPEVAQLEAEGWLMVEVGGIIADHGVAIVIWRRPRLSAAMA